MSIQDHISCLPPEILLHIFKHALPGPLHKEGRVHFQAIRSVCSDWRLLSFSSPVLWSSLALRCQGRYLDPPVGSAIAERWLARAGRSTPLDLHVFDPTSRAVETDHEGLAGLIARYRSRWRSLFILGAGTIFWDIFQQAPPSDWASLRELTIPIFHLCDGAGGGGIETLQQMTSIQATPVQYLHLDLGSAFYSTIDFSFISAYTHL
ncbi:hypothetical protein BKA70DRAFT_1165191, partial [Coprinopsis sp. MPI-PUGE-AT-0042]